MNKGLTIKLAFVFIVLFNWNCLGQNNSILLGEKTIGGTFCDMSSDTSTIFFTVSSHDLEACDFAIHCNDTSFKVVEFQLGLVPVNSSSEYIEELIKLSRIPEKYRQTILSETQTIYLEKILALNIKGEKVYVKPFGIRVKSR